MRIVYTDENKRLRDFGELMSSFEFRNFVERNLTLISRYDYGTVRVKPDLFKKQLAPFLRERGFEIGNRTEHANGIGNNNMNYVRDVKSGEYIGALHLNTNMANSMYCYATDIHENKVSDTYSISPHGITRERPNWVDWNEYSFGKEEYTLSVIEDAIKAKVLAEGPNGGVMVIKGFPDGSEHWQEMSKEDAAKDLVEQDKVYMLAEAVEKRSPFNGAQNLYAQAYCDFVELKALISQHKGSLEAFADANGLLGNWYENHLECDFGAISVTIFQADSITLDVNTDKIDIYDSSRSEFLQEGVSFEFLKNVCEEIGFDVKALESNALSRIKKGLDDQIKAAASRASTDGSPDRSSEPER